MNTPNSQVTEQVRVVIAEMRATGQHQEVFGDRIHEWAEDLEAALTARTEAANTIHSCSYYCDRPECVKAQRDDLREAYVVRGREYPNERPQPAQGDGPESLLRSFALDVLDYWPDGAPDGGDLQELAVKHGLLIATPAVVPCGEDCACTEFYDVGDTADCYRRAPWLKTPPAPADGGKK